MAMKKRPEYEEEGPEATPLEAGEMLTTETNEPMPPKSMSDEEVQRIRNQVIEIVKQLEDATGSKELELLDSITNVGLQAQRGAAGQMDLLRAQIGTFLNEGGTGREVANGLRDLRMTLNEINPHQLSQRSIWGRAYGLLPFFKGRHNLVVRAIHKIALRYEPVLRQVSVIETKLREGRALLVRDNVELRKLYQDMESQQPPIQRNAYLGELLMQHLAQVLEQTEDLVQRERIQGALHDVAMRVQDLRTMEEVYIQYFVSIEMSRQNNNRLGQSIERTLSVASNVVIVGLAIQSALVRQGRVMEAAQRTREFLGDLVAANAVAIRRQTQEIGDLYNQPVLALEKITQAHNDLVEALTTAGRLREEGVEVARENIAKLGQMMASLEQRVSGPLDEVGSRPDSVEA